MDPIETTAPEPTPRDEGALDAERRRLLLVAVRFLLPAALIFTFAALPFVPAEARGTLLASGLSAAAAAAILLKVRLGYRTLSLTVLVVGGVSMLALAAHGGPRPAVYVNLASLLVFAALLTDLRTTVICGVAGIGGLALVGWGHVAGVLPLRPLYAVDVGDPVWWRRAIIGAAGAALPAAALTVALVRALSRELERTAALVNTLRAEVLERQAAIEKLRETQAQLGQAQKMELVGQLAGGIAHDVNNALTAVLGETSLLDDSVAESRERLLQATEDAAQLTRQLLMLARRDVARPRVIDLVTHVRRASNYARRTIPSDIKVDLAFPSEPVPVFADPLQLSQVVLNLAMNARDAMHGGGLLQLSVVATEPRWASIVIADSGVGIAPDVLPRIFEPFFSTKDANVGTGLGLANVKATVEELGGTVSVKSTPGQGARFEVRLPRRTGAEIEIESTRTPIRGANERILVVDDDIGVRWVALGALRRAGFRVLEASNPRDAIATLRESTDCIDLVVTDVVMPHGGGSALLDWLRAERPTVPVLVISGYTPDEAIRRGIAAEQVDALTKPFTGSALVTAVAQALARGRPQPRA